MVFLLFLPGRGRCWFESRSFARTAQLDESESESFLKALRLLIDGLVELFSSISPREGGGDGSGWKVPSLYSAFPNPPPSDPADWRELYGPGVKERLSDRVEIVALKEEMEVYGLARVMAQCSGFAIGSCNWIIRTDFHKVHPRLSRNTAGCFTERLFGMPAAWSRDSRRPEARSECRRRSG